jgi:hypothetical protein
MGFTLLVYLIHYKVIKIPRIRIRRPKRIVGDSLLDEEDPILPHIGSNTSVKSDTSATSSLSFLAKSLQIERSDLEIIKRISEGSYGVVFLGKYRGSHVAVKKLKIDDPVSFEQEVSSLISLRHPNIVLFIGVCATGEYKLIVTVCLSFINTNIVGILF